MMKRHVTAEKQGLSYYFQDDDDYDNWTGYRLERGSGQKGRSALSMQGKCQWQTQSEI